MEPVSDPRIYSNRYQVTHLIARGGMAMVYRAQDLLLNRPVALKILYPELGADPLFVERFRREAQAAANLSHPNIVPVFDWGEDDGTYFIVMELVDGTSLADVLRGSRTLTPSRSAQLAAQVAAALGYAHRSGVVHRDVKPGNILITADGQVKVTDFGIAQAVSSEDHLAEAGSVMGTATYFSPEQAEGAAVDGRSDVYSLGVVLYEMLAGRPPFIGDSPVEVSSQHVHRSVPPLSDFSDAVPHDLEAIVMEALGKSPAQRYQSADEFRADLLRFVEGQPVRAVNRDVAFFGADATRSVSAVPGGERTESVPVMSGPRTDVRRGGGRGRSGGGASGSGGSGANRTGIIATVIIVIIAAAGLTYFLVAPAATITTMPNVVGQSITSALGTLTSDGLKIGPTSQVQSSKVQGTVLSTDPKAGVKVANGQTVSLRVSTGPSTSPVSVPDVTNMTLVDAESTLTVANLNFKPEFTNTMPAGGATPGDVVSQSPTGGTTARTGDTVILVVLNSNVPFRVPSVSGDTSDQAASILGQSNLSLSATSASKCSNTLASGLVIATSPAAGASVTSGTQIELITSTGFCNVYVADVMGDTPQAAAATLEAQGLVIGTTTTASDPACTTANSGLVDTQSLAPGSPAPYGSAVDIATCP